MLEKLITNLKNSLGSKKKNSNDAEENDDESESNSSEENNSEELEASPDADAEKAKNKRSMIIKVIVVLALVYLVVDQFLLKPEEAPVTEVASPGPKKNKKQAQVPVDATAAATDPTATAPVEPATVPPTDPAAAPVESPTAVTEAPVAPVAPVAPAPVPEAPVESAGTITQAPIAAPTPEPAPSPDAGKVAEAVLPAAPETPMAPIENPTVLEKPAEVKEATPVVSNLGEAKSVEKQIDKEIDKLIEKDEQKGMPEVVSDMKSKITATEEAYVEPPSYEDLGRGLVYNCKEKFWVCVDKISYSQCGKNMKYNKEHQKPAECAVVNVYSSNDDCSLIQKYNVSKNKTTDFCN
jgi:hypothetical protein